MPAERRRDQGPDEDAFVIPAHWRRHIHPRRGGVPGPALRPPADPAAAERALIDPVRPAAMAVLHHEQTDEAVAAEAKAYLGGGASPRGAAAAAMSAACTYEWRHSIGAFADFADVWVAAHGVVFAARVVAELAGLTTESWPGNYIRPAPPDFDPEVRFAHWDAAARRVRAYLAAAPDDEYRRACEVLAAYRDGPLRQRIVVSYLVPGQTNWVDEDCAASSRLAAMLLCAASKVDHLRRLASYGAIYSPSSPEVPMTVAEGVGVAAAPVFARWFDEAEHAGHKKRLVGILSALPTDEAFGLMLDRMDQKYVRPALIDAMDRYPVRALRLLSQRTGTTATELLRGHVAARPDLVAEVLPTLAPEVRERVEAVSASAAEGSEAPADQLPPVLVEPPWTRERAAVRPAVVEGLAAAVEPRMAWAPGEREAWIAATPVYGELPTDWPQVARAYREHRLAEWDRVNFLCHAPEDLVRPLLDHWKPSYVYYAASWIKPVIARLGVEAASLALHVARAMASDGPTVLMPFATSEVATLTADWLTRTKGKRAGALAWLTRHPDVAAATLVPAALGRPGPDRRAAEHTLRVIDAAGHRERVRAAARTHGPAAVAGIEALLATDPLDLVPAKLPTLPDWADATLLPQVLLADRRHTLPVASVRHLCMMLAISKPAEVYAGVDVVKRVCDPESLAEFGWALFLRWQAAGLPSKQGWVLDALGWIGDDETVRRLSPIIRAWPGEGGHSRAVNGLDVLAGIGTDVALMHLHGISQKAKFKGLKDRAADKIAEVAAGLGFTAEQLADRLVPDLGLDADGGVTLDYGPRRFTVGFDEHLRPYVTDADGKRRKDLPKPGARDDAALAEAAYKRFGTLKKDVRTIASDQIRRLEQAMVWRRRWTGQEFRELFVARPLLWHIVRRLVWGTFADDDTVDTGLRVAEDRTFTDVNDDAVVLPDDARVGIAHPLHLGAAVPAWSELFADYEIGQPFAQLGRDIHRLTDDEADRTTLERYADRTVATFKVLGLERRGWRRGEGMDAGVQSWVYRIVPGDRAVVVNIEPGIAVGAVDEWPEQKIETVWINDRPTGDGRSPGKIQFRELDPVTASEVLRDLADLEG